MRVLVVEDEVRTAAAVERSLTREGLVVDVVGTGEAGLSQAQMVEYDVVVLDVMLPDLSGFEICRQLRERGTWVPVLLLTAREGVGDRVEGLDSGADDYLVKPFAIAELLARLRALARRGAAERPAVLTIGDLSLDPATRIVRRGSTEIALSAKEFALLEAFLRRPGIVLSRSQLLDYAWDFAYEAQSNVVDVYVRRLRDRIDRPFGRRTLQTVAGVGYVLRDDGGA